MYLLRILDFFGHDQNDPRMTQNDVKKKTKNPNFPTS